MTLITAHNSSMKRILIVALLSGLVFGSYAQNKRICVMGSSSAYGYFTINNVQLYPRDSGWAFKLKKHFKDLGVIDTLFNIAANGSSCYHGMPSSYTPPPGRSLPYYPFNITKAVQLLPKPDVIIVNFPSNQYDYLSTEEIMFCLQTIKDSANASGIRCFITTSQPRDRFSPPERQRLKVIRDSIMQRFGPFAIDFWTDVTVPVNRMNPEYNLGDSIHLNPAAHTLLKNRTVNANIFFSTVPVSLTQFNAQKKAHAVLLQWTTATAVNIHHFEIQKSTDGRNFVHLATVAAAGNSSQIKTYTIEDLHPANGNNFYRVITVDMLEQKEFSKKLKVDFSAANFYAGEVYSNPVVGTFAINLESAKKQVVEIALFSAEGKRLSSEKIVVASPLIYKKEINKMPAGRYTLRITTKTETVLRNFIKL